MRKSIALLGCLGILIAPVSIGTAKAHEMYSTTTTTTTSTCATETCGWYYGYDHHVDPRVAYRHYGEYVVNPLEMTDTRDNRANIPGGDNSITNYREYRGEQLDNSTDTAAYHHPN